MRDVFYVGVVVTFFVLMLAYIRGCVALGEDESVETARS